MCREWGSGRRNRVTVSLFILPFNLQSSLRDIHDLLIFLAVEDGKEAMSD